MTGPRRARRRQTIIGLALELLCMFFLGFMASCVVGVAVAWVLGMHIPEEFHPDDDFRSIHAQAQRRVTWLLPTDPSALAGHDGSPSCSASWSAPHSGGSGSISTVT